MKRLDALKEFMKFRQLTVDSTALKLVKDEQLLRLWSASGDLIHYSDNLMKVTSYSALELCYYNMKDLMSFENEGYDIFKNAAAKALLGQPLPDKIIYTSVEKMGEQRVHLQKLELCVPVFEKDEIAGLLIAGSAELIRRNSA